MLLADRDIKAETESGWVKFDAYEPELIQPSSSLVRPPSIRTGRRSMVPGIKISVDRLRQAHT